MNSSILHILTSHTDLVSINPDQYLFVGHQFMEKD